MMIGNDKKVAEGKRKNWGIEKLKRWSVLGTKWWADKKWQNWTGSSVIPCTEILVYTIEKEIL